MPSQEGTYVGLRGAQPGYGHGGPVVVGVCRDGERRSLTHDDPRLIEAEFEWGYEGAGRRRLAQAILNDFLGFNVDLIVGAAFLRSVVARLPSESSSPEMRSPRGSTTGSCGRAAWSRRSSPANARARAAAHGPSADSRVAA
jgi:hypothetical protein